MRSYLVLAAGLMMGWLPVTALDSAHPQSAIPYSGEALRLAIADGMSRAGATVVSAESTAPARRH
jgi:hypothetical protein